MDKMAKFINCHVPTELCNLSCEYCYVRQARIFNNKIMVLPHSLDKMRKSFSKERLGGKCLINLCASGETLLADDIVPFIEELLKEGHYVSIITNGTISKAFDKLIKIESKYIKHIFVKFSFHFLELKKRNLLDIFFDNVKKISESGASFTVELMASDSQIPYISEIKDICMKNVGALPHLSLVRNDTSKNLEILTDLPIDEFKYIWGQFDSAMFDLKLSIYEGRKIKYCYAGEFTSVLDLETGEMSRCYGMCSDNNIYDVDNPVAFTLVGDKCKQPYCFNGHAFYAMGVNPEADVVTYAKVRDRMNVNTGRHWLNEEVYNFFNQKFYDNYEYDAYHYRGEDFYNYENRKIIIFGAGVLSDEAFYTFGSDNIAYYVDNNKTIVGDLKNGKKILSFDELKDIYNDYDIVVSVNRKNYEQITKQLSENGIYNFYSRDQLKIKYDFENKKEKNIILFNVAEHTNMGDHAITEATNSFFSRYFTDYNVIEIPVKTLYNESEYIKKYINKNDILVISGGGFLGSLYVEGGESNVRSVILNYPDNKIVIMPQSMFFHDNDFGKEEMQKSIEIYNSHNNLHIFFREKFSYNLASEIFDKKVNKYLVPDIVLSLNYSQNKSVRDKVALFLRTDIEKIVSDEMTENIKELLENNKINFIESSMHDNDAIYLYMRKKKVTDKINKFKTYKLVITDTLHCMIFCAITGTPCIVFNNISRKTEGVYEWINDLPYIKFADENADIDVLIKELSALKNTSYDNLKINKMLDTIAEVIVEE